MEQDSVFKTAEQMRIETLENLVKLENEEIFHVLQLIQKMSGHGEFTCYWGKMFPKTKKILIELGFKLIKSYSHDVYSDETEETENEECYDISWR